MSQTLLHQLEQLINAKRLIEHRDAFLCEHGFLFLHIPKRGSTQENGDVLGSTMKLELLQIVPATLTTSKRKIEQDEIGMKTSNLGEIFKEDL
ncbi:MAG TPA: hypothetical protein VFN35_06585 [Ktedonobacteraceae bacterium]|nr:hypothetical protein [Ktedonobacteraceae bacterium]